MLNYSYSLLLFGGILMSLKWYQKTTVESALLKYFELIVLNATRTIVKSQKFGIALQVIMILPFESVEKYTKDIANKYCLRNVH
jgi:hypothetical protein